VRAIKTSRNLLEERLNNVLEILWFNHAEYLFKLVEEHQLLRAARFRPVLEQALNDYLRQAGIFFYELHHAIN
jgi:hypothetical protein